MLSSSKSLKQLGYQRGVVPQNLLGEYNASSQLILTHSASWNFTGRSPAQFTVVSWAGSSWDESALDKFAWVISPISSPFCHSFSISIDFWCHFDYRSLMTLSQNYPRYCCRLTSSLLWHFFSFWSSVTFGARLHALLASVGHHVTFRMKAIPCWQMHKQHRYVPSLQGYNYYCLMHC